MKILLIEDDPLEQLKIHTLLKEWQMEVRSVETAAEGSALFHAERPDLVLLDWMLPDRSGLELCREFRQTPSRNPCYIIFVTGRTESREIVNGLEAGANDYISKPYRESELLARVQVGQRMVTLQKSLSERVRELEEAMARIQTLSGLLPICAGCKKIRDDKGYWTQVESYISDRSNARFSHGFCPECYRKAMEELEQLGPTV